VRDDTVDGIPVRRLAWNWQAAPDPFRYLYDNPEVNQEFGKYIAWLRPDVVHITSCYAFGAGIIEATHRAGIPVFLTFTDFWFLCPRHTLWRGDGTLCDGPRDAATCSACMSAAAPVGRTVQALLPAQIAGNVLRQLARVPAIARQRGFRGYVGDTEARLTSLHRMFDLIDVPIAPSRFMIEMLGRNGYDASRIRYSPYGHDLQWLSRLEPRVPDGCVRIGYLGQIDPLKGVDVLIDAFRQLGPEPPVKLCLYGNFAKNPDYVAILRQRAAGDQRIHFVGSFERSQIAEVFSDLDVVVVPSVWYENTPIVISEAFAARKVVVATNLGGMSEAIQHDINGLLFERGDVAGLAAIIRRLATDTSLLDRLRRGIAPPRSIDAEMNELLQAYDGAMTHVVA
jgi:glycosyltransferase involved in cell wall biosynthesis